MILYHGGGASDIMLLQKQFTSEEWSRLRGTIIRLLRTRNATRAAELLESIPFEVYEATNGFNDEFAVLHVAVPLEQYTELVDLETDPASKRTFQELAWTISKVGPHIRFITAFLDTEAGLKPVDSPVLQITSDVVEHALADAAHLIQSRGAMNSIDRAHTAFHAYLHAVCKRSSIMAPEDTSITHLFKLIREQHPAFQGMGPRAEDISRIIRAAASILDALNPLRNRASLAHPNEELLDEPEAMLVINSIRTLLHYLDQKLKER
jgi:hypothetical protein